MVDSNKAREILMKYVPADCYWVGMDNLVNTPVKYILLAMIEYAKIYNEEINSKIIS